MGWSLVGHQRGGFREAPPRPQFSSLQKQIVELNELNLQSPSDKNSLRFWESLRFFSRNTLLSRVHLYQALFLPQEKTQFPVTTVSMQIKGPEPGSIIFGKTDRQRHHMLCGENSSVTAFYMTHHVSTRRLCL